MPLTGAERAKRFRENLKNDPEKYEKYKEKQRERVSKLRRKIDDLNESQKEKQRELWRKQKRRQKDKRTITKEDTIQEKKSEKPKSTLKLNIKLKKAYANYAQSQKNEAHLKCTVDRLRKQLSRSKQMIKALEIAQKKTETRYENLVDAIKETYDGCQTHNEKRLLKKVSAKFSHKSGLKSKILGLKSKVRFFKPNILGHKLVKVNKFLNYFCKVI